MKKNKFDFKVEKEQKEYWDNLLKPLYKANILLEEEKIYDAKRAIAINSSNSSVPGLLVITQIRIIFLLDKTESAEGPPSYIGLLHNKIQEVNINVNELNKSQGELTVYSENMVFSFKDLMRFGLSEWEKFVRKNKK